MKETGHTTGRRKVQCQCGIWIDWKVAGKRIRKPLQTRDWAITQGRARVLESEGISTNLTAQTVEEVCKRFVEDAQSRGLRPPSIYKYELLFRQLKDFCEAKGIVFIGGLGLEELRAFRATWINKNLSAGKKLEYPEIVFSICARQRLD